MSRLIILHVLMMVANANLSAQNLGSQENQDLYSLILVTTDLQDATQMMTVYDPNEDGFIDASEQDKLAWKDDDPS